MLASGSRRDDRLYAVQEVRGYVHLGRSQMFFDKRSVAAAGIRWPCVRVHVSTGTLSSMITLIGKSCGERMEWGEVWEELELVGKYSICVKHPRRGQPLKHVSCASDPLVLTPMTSMYWSTVAT
jgi:hypothetical protein